MRGTGMGSGGEYDFRHALEQIGGFRAPSGLLLQIEKNFLDDQPAEAVTNEYNWTRPETRLGQQEFENVDGPVLQRHRGAKPIGNRRLISQ